MNVSAVDLYEYQKIRMASGKLIWSRHIELFSDASEVITDD
jgi:hypothetical protein